jgi:signal transduction histidine kinase
MEGRSWLYTVSPLFGIVASSELDFNYSPYTYYEYIKFIRFLDVTESQQMLQSLVLTLGGLAVIILTIFFFISQYFANKAIEPMKVAFENQSRFVADASHELKTPLSVIQANCGVLYANSEETVDSQIKWVNHIVTGADRMDGLIKDLLSLSCLEDAKPSLTLSSFDLSSTVTEVLERIMAAAREKDISVDLNIEPDIMVLSDNKSINQVLHILLDNAVKYTDNGGDISVSLAKVKRRTMCVIRNSGEGISPEHLPRLFDRFYRVDASRAAENGGYGLGLAIANAVCNHIGAKLSVKSELGSYTEFTLII